MEESKLYQSFKSEGPPKDTKQLYEDASRRIAEVKEKIGDLPFVVDD